MKGHKTLNSSTHVRLSAGHAKALVLPLQREPCRERAC